MNFNVEIIIISMFVGLMIQQIAWIFIYYTSYEDCLDISKTGLICSGVSLLTITMMTLLEFSYPPWFETVISILAGICISVIICNVSQILTLWKRRW